MSPRPKVKPVSRAAVAVVAVVVANAVVMRLRQMATLKPLPRRLALKPSMMPCRLLPWLPLRLP